MSVISFRKLLDRIIKMQKTKVYSLLSDASYQSLKLNHLRRNSLIIHKNFYKNILLAVYCSTQQKFKYSLRNTVGPSQGKKLENKKRAM